MSLAYLETCLKERSCIAIRMKTIFNVNEHLSVLFFELTRIGSSMGHLCFCGLYRITCLNSFCLKSSFVLALCFIIVCMVDQTQMYPSCISPLGLFQGITCNIEQLIGGSFGALNCWGNLYWRREPQTPLHTLVKMQNDKPVTENNFVKKGLFYFRAPELRHPYCYAHKESPEYVTISNKTISLSRILTLSEV